MRKSWLPLTLVFLLVFSFWVSVKAQGGSNQPINASCTTNLLAVDMLEKSTDVIDFTLNYSNSSGSDVGFRATMKANIFFGPEQIIAAARVPSGLGQQHTVSLQTTNVLALGTDEVVVEVTSSATGTKVLARCMATLTFYLPNEITIAHSVDTPVIDGECADYRDANAIRIKLGSYPIARVFAKHTDTDLYICLSYLKLPDPAATQFNHASVFINRLGRGGDTPGADDIAFSITYDGVVTVRRGDGRGYTGPDPGGYTIKQRILRGYETPPYAWEAEFRISRATLGGGEWDRDINIAFAESSVNSGKDAYLWPTTARDHQPNTWGIGHLVSTPPPWVADVRPMAIEVTQTIQDLNNSVVLVANKRTFVRVHLATNIPVANLTARLSGFRNGVELGPPLLPANPGAAINVVPAPDRVRLSDSFYFELPVSWINPGTITLRAVLNPYHEIGETNYNNNEITSAPLTFQSTKALKLRFVEYAYIYQGQRIGPTSLDTDKTVSLLRRLFPIPGVDSVRYRILDGCIDPIVVLGQKVCLNTYKDPLHAPSTTVMLNLLRGWRQTWEPNTPNTIYYGLYTLPEKLLYNPIGEAYPNDQVATGQTRILPAQVGEDVNSSTSAVAAHEIGHLFWRRHVPCSGSEEGTDPAYPYPKGIIGGPANDTARYAGFDAGDRRLGLSTRIIPHTWVDIMSYCDNKWISDYTYKAIWDMMQIRVNLAGDIAPAYTMGDFLSVYGSIDFSTETALLVFLSRQAQVGDIPPLQPGPYHILLLDANKTLLADYAFTPDISREEPTQGFIGQIVTFIPGTRYIQIYSDVAGRMIGSAEVSSNAPVVKVTSLKGGPEFPATGPVTIGWSGSDGDNDALSYTLLYSSDNRDTWRVLATRMVGNQATIDAAQLEGTVGAANGYFRVVASDDVLTGSADSEPFNVAGKAPVVRITSPTDSSTFLYGQTVTLQGFAQDFEDGSLEDTKLIWSSNRDGLLGSGSLLHLALLSAGTHLITLTATDSIGQRATETVDVNIAADLSSDLFPPTILCSPTDDRWHASDVIFTCTATDSQSGLARVEDEQFLLTTNVLSGTETVDATTDRRSVCDVVGNCAAAGPIRSLKVDKQAPSITINAPIAGVSYSFNQTVTANYDCADHGAGVASCVGPVVNGATIDTTSLGSKTFTVNALDQVGNVSAMTITYKVHLDTGQLVGLILLVVIVISIGAILIRYIVRKRYRI